MALPRAQIGGQASRDGRYVNVRANRDQLIS
jgi:hypothetical protein